MKLRAISGIRTGSLRSTQGIGLDDDDSAITRSSLAPVPRIKSLSRRETYQKMNLGLSAWQHRLRKPSRRQTSSQSEGNEITAAATGATLALADIAPLINTPSLRRSIPARKTVMQLRMLFVRRPRTLGRTLNSASLDHDTLPGTDNDRHPDGFRRHDVPAASGPIDGVMASTRTAPTLPYRLLGATDDAVRQQVAKKIRP